MKLKFLDSLSIYEGETKNNLLDGFGTLKTSKGKYYEIFRRLGDIMYVEHINYF